MSAGDAALRGGLPRVDLERDLVRMAGWPGVRAARRVVGFLDPRSETVGESVSRVRMHLDGLPAPELQHEFVVDRRVLARVDFAPGRTSRRSASSTGR